MSDLGDLTQFIEEAEGEGTDFTYKGVNCHIPASPSLKVMLKTQKIFEEKGEKGELSQSEVLEMNKMFIGEDTFNKLVEAGISLAGFEALLTEYIMPNVNLANNAEVEQDDTKN